MIQITCPCPACYPLLVTEQMVGQRITCPYSGMPFTVGRVAKAPRFGAAQWAACDDPRLLAQCLEHLGPLVSPAKRRLLACACCRRHWDRLPDERSRRAVEVAERYADSQASRRQLAAAWRAANAAAREVEGHPDPVNFPRLAAICAEEPLTGMWPLSELSGVAMEARCGMVREVVGNPFRPVAADPSWLAWNGGCVVRLARAILDGERFDNLPVLADALEEAGCTDPDVLAHCRGGGEHVRGCWVLGLLVGRG
jgi:hypothetical protein